jgi:hypothetical protein
MRRHIGHAAIAAVLLASWACSGVPPRPAGVPRAAVWAGGTDGGVWIDCRVSIADNVDVCDVYDDHSGKKRNSGMWRLRGLNRAATTQELQFEGYDGELILLRNALVLQRIDHAVTN